MVSSSIARSKMAVFCILAVASVGASWPHAATNMQSLRVLHAAETSPEAMVLAADHMLRDNRRAALWQGLATFNARQLDTSQQILTRGILRHPNDALLRIALARAYWAAGRSTEAADQWVLAGAWGELARTAQSELNSRHWDAAVLLATAAEKGSPEVTVVVKARALAGKGDHDRALAVLSQALATNPGSKKRQAWLVAQGDIDASVEYWRAAGQPYADTGRRRAPQARLPVLRWWRYRADEFWPPVAPPVPPGSG